MRNAVFFLMAGLVLPTAAHANPQPRQHRDIIQWAQQAPRFGLSDPTNPTLSLERKHCLTEKKTGKLVCKTMQDWHIFAKKIENNKAN